MDSPFISLSEATKLGRYSTEKALRRDMERGNFVNGIHYFNRHGLKKGAILFYREKFIAALEGREILNPEDFAKKKK